MRTITPPNVPIGTRFGSLVTTAEPVRPNGVWKVPCRCDCGQSTLPSVHAVRNGLSRSCGCLAIRRMGEACTTHGETRTRLHGIWQAMIGRCHRPRHSAYPRYGGRGIAVCPEWREDYIAFRDWARANGYEENLSIDRIDGDGNYEPGNCRWASPTQQATNKSNNRLVTAWGETKCLADWLRDPRCKPVHSCLLARLDHEWPPERALSTDSQPKGPRLLTAFGETKRASDWVRDPRCAVNRNTLLNRIDQGLPAEQAITLPGQVTQGGRGFKVLAGELRK